MSLGILCVNWLAIKHLMKNKIKQAATFLAYLSANSFISLAKSRVSAT